MKKWIFIAAVALASCNGNENTTAQPQGQNETQNVAPAKSGGAAVSMNSDQQPNHTASAGQQAASANSQSFPVDFYNATDTRGQWKMNVKMEQNGSFTATLEDIAQNKTYIGHFRKNAPIVDGKPLVAADETLYSGVFEGSVKGGASQIRIKGKEMKDNKGTMHATMCTINFDGQQFLGYGDYVE